LTDRARAIAAVIALFGIAPVQFEWWTRRSPLGASSDLHYLIENVEAAFSGQSWIALNCRLVAAEVPNGEGP